MTADAATHRRLAIEANNSTWDHLGNPVDKLSSDDREEMTRRAYAAAYHWQRAEGTTPANAARADWLLSRVWVVQGEGERALHHARRCLAVCEQEGLGDFDLAYAHEAMARASASLGDSAATERHLAAARAVPIADPEDAQVVTSDLAAEPWFGYGTSDAQSPTGTSTVPRGREFEDQDLSGSVFWGVDLRRSLFRDVDLSSSRVFHALLRGVDVDGLVDRLVVNGVDVTAYVNARDRWYPLRAMLEPASAEGIREASAVLRAEWDTVLARLAAVGPGLGTTSVNGEWSVRDTLRHLVFAMEKWFFGPVLGRRSFTPLGLPNSGSQDRPWPGIDRDADPSFEEAVGVWKERWREWVLHLAELDLAAVPDTVEVEENGAVPGILCFHVVLEETFEHLRYVLRDIEQLLPTEDHT